MKPFKITPSFLSWTWKGCPRCAWREFNGLKKPSAVGASISVGNHFDRAAKDRILAGQAMELGIPYAISSAVAREYVRSRVIEVPGTDLSFFISGKMDRLFHLQDDSFAVIDFKAGVGDPEQYWLAMMAYLMCLEMPDVGDRVEVSVLGILAMNLRYSKVVVDAKKRKAALTAELVWTELQIDRAKFLEDVGDMMKVLACADMPERGKWCEFCLCVESAMGVDRGQ